MSETDAPSPDDSLTQPPPLHSPLEVRTAAEQLAPHDRQELIRHLVAQMRKNGQGLPSCLSGWTPPDRGGIGEDEYGERRWMSGEELRERGLPGG